MNATEISSPPLQEKELANVLRIRATHLSYMAFAVCVERLLAFEGYEGIRSFGRTSFRGGAPDGGADMAGLAPLPFGKVATLIQLKRYARAVPRRFVDELRGTMMRYQVPNGVLLTTATFSRPGRLAAANYPGRPIRLIDGAELGRLMLHARIGIAEETDIDSGAARLRFSEETFRNLERFCAEARRSGYKGSITNDQ